MQMKSRRELLEDNRLRPIERQCERCRDVFDVDPNGPNDTICESCR